MKNFILSIVFILGLGQVMAQSPDCTNCFDDGPNGCGYYMYVDNDGDGFGGNTKVCYYPGGSLNNLAAKSGDCNDNDDDIYPRTFYKDLDGDGFGTVSAKICWGPSGTPPGYTDKSGDCDDTRTDITVKKNWYADVDQDGYGNETTKYHGCTPPTNMQNPVNQGGDLDDGNAAITDIPGQTFYYDNDGDDYGTNSNTEFRSRPSTPKYVSKGNDCNDNDITLHPKTVWYKDTDGDQLGDSGDVLIQCMQPPGNYVRNGGDVCPAQPGPEGNGGCPVTDLTPEPWNTITSIAYDINGGVKVKSKVYTDKLGKTHQTQTLDVQTNKVWANQTMYDNQGRPSLSTLSAPLGVNGYFFYKEDFVTDVTGNGYDIQDMENPNGPTAVGAGAGTLGWYYSNNNTDEPYQDITEYPFSKTVYSQMTPGGVKEVLGGKKINGNWLQSYSFSMEAHNELLPLETNLIGTTSRLSDKVIKTISRDVHGVENVAYSDANGRVLATAKSGGGQIRTFTNSVTDKGYVDVHVPHGNGLGFSVNLNPGGFKVHDLITEAEVGYSTNLPNGFYRVSAPANEDGTYPEIQVTYKIDYFDYSLNEYDESGRLVASFQPLQNLKTEYDYDSRGRLVYTKNPDEGEAWFKYRQDGQIRYSQNSLQKQQGKVSFTDYDSKGRPIHSGVMAYTGFTGLDPDTAKPSVSLSEESHTQYDYLDTPIPSAAPNGYKNPLFLAGNVARTQNNESTTYYSYDVYGRVSWVLQYIASLNAYKTIDYDYDPISGAVTQVIYQKNQTGEYFEHLYSYDVLDRLVGVQTRTASNGAYETQAEYTYSQTGQLKRMELADGAQGVDYVYNLSGQLKAINHPSLDANKDPNGNISGPADLFGMQIDYHQNDYSRNQPHIGPVDFGEDQYNGNIKAIRWGSGTGGTQHTYSYTYDRNQWLTQADYGNYDPTMVDASVLPNPSYGNTYNSGVTADLKGSQSVTLTDDFHAKAGSTVQIRVVSVDGFQDVGNGDYDVTGIEYDANGNIQRLDRNKHTQNGSNTMDRLAYEYKTDEGKPNQLKRVTDNWGTNGDAPNADDLVSQTGEYIYNNIGQLIENTSENLKYYYNTAGLVTEVQKNNVPLVKFFYNDRNQRVRKESYNSTTLTRTTYYVRDMAGQVMGIYSQQGNGAVALVERPIYGASRIGVEPPGGNTLYELTDHLGNVRAVFTKDNATVNATAVIQGHTDYYPGGMPMPYRNDQTGYRYGYQGQYAETDEETGKPAFELRLYDPRINRWLTTDPMGQFASPYLAMGNNWISYVDPDGGECCNGWKKDSEGNNMLDEVVVTAGNGSWTSELTSRYAYSGTFEMWKQEFNRTGSYLQELQNWEAEHGETFRQLTAQWDREEQNRRTLEKLAFFSGGFGTIGQVVAPSSLPTARPFGFKGVVGKPNITTLSPFKLEATHAVTLSKSRFQELVDAIKVRGKVTETVKYVNHSGRRYIVNGHHRSYIAKRLGYDVPVEEVSLPYGNYRNASDLIYEGSNPGYLNYIKY